MKFIVITSPDFIPNEVRRITNLFESGLDLLHLRKPGASEDDCARLIESVPEDWRGRIVVHDHFNLCLRYGLHGVHLNRRNPVPPSFVEAPGGGFSLSASCHSVAEAAERKPHADYVFLSPIFNSISKQGYMAAFPPEELAVAAADGVLDDRVMALGGVTADSIPLLRSWHFGGAVFLGDVWSKAAMPEKAFLDYARLLAEALHKPC